MFSRILVPLDGSALAEQAIPVAARIIHASGAHLLLVRAIAAPVTYGVIYDAEPLRYRIIQDDTEAARDYLRDVARSTPLSRLSADVIVEVGAPASIILDAADNREADLVVLTSHGRTGLGRWVLGSVAEHVVHHAPVPVLLLRGYHDGVVDLARPHAAQPLRVLVPLDGSPLAEAVLTPVCDIALALAEDRPVAIHLTLVISPYDAKQTNMPDALIVDGAKAYLARAARQLLNASDAGRLTVTWSVAVNGDFAYGILSAADGTASLAATAEHATGGSLPGQHDSFDLIAMATHGYSGLARWMVGSVTERVLRASHRSMFIVRPKDLVERPHEDL